MGRRESQQDAFGFSNFSNGTFAEHGGYAAVLADGMGGLSNGVWASAQAVRLFIEAYQAKSAGESIPDALRRAVHVSNTVVHDEAMRLDLVDRMGTTLVAAAVCHGELHWISVGDSRVYLFEAGRLARLSTDHSYGEVLRQQVVRGEISVSEARAHPMRNALTSYLGRPEPLKVDLPSAPLRIAPGAWVLLCSDGLSGVLSDAEIAAQLSGDPQQACDRLLHAAIDRGLTNQDNTTVVILHVPAEGEVSRGASLSQAAYEHLPTVLPWWRRASTWAAAGGVLMAMTASLAAWAVLQRGLPVNGESSAVPISQTGDVEPAVSGRPAEPANPGIATEPPSRPAPPPTPKPKPKPAPVKPTPTSRVSHGPGTTPIGDHQTSGPSAEPTTIPAPVTAPPTTTAPLAAGTGKVVTPPPTSPPADAPKPPLEPKSTPAARHVEP